MENEDGSGDKDRGGNNASMQSPSTFMFSSSNHNNANSTSEALPSGSNVGAQGDITTKENLKAHVEQLVNDINSKRKEDTYVLSNFGQAIRNHVEETVRLAETSLFDLYERRTSEFDAKVEELFATFDRIAKIEQELETFRSALKVLHDELQGDV